MEEGHLAYFIRDVVGELDLSAIYADYRWRRGGQPAYDPQMMVSLLLYGYCVGMASSRKIAQATYEQVKLGHVALDGTKVQANASKHKAISYGRMKQEIARLGGEVEQLMAQAEVIDSEEDECYGVGNRGDELPKELRHRQQRGDGDSDVNRSQWLC